MDYDIAMITELEVLSKRIDKIEKQKTDEVLTLVEILSNVTFFGEIKQASCEHAKDCQCRFFILTSEATAKIPIVNICQVKKCRETTPHSHLELSHITCSLCELKHNLISPSISETKIKPKKPNKKNKTIGKIQKGKTIEVKKMTKKAITLAISVLILTSAFFVLGQNNTSSASTSNPSKLYIYTGPTRVLADNNTYKCIFVELQDSSGLPARALQDTTISLASSLPSIGTVNSIITIPNGTTYASANFNTTFSPGTTTISASATGYATVQATMTTIGPIPSTIAVYGFHPHYPQTGISIKQ